MFLYWNGNQQRVPLFLFSFYFLLLIKAKIVLRELKISLTWSSILPGKGYLISWNASAHTGWGISWRIETGVHVPAGLWSHRHRRDVVGWLLWLELWKAKTRSSLERKGQEDEEGLSPSDTMTLWSAGHSTWGWMRGQPRASGSGSKGEHALMRSHPEYCCGASSIRAWTCWNGSRGWSEGRSTAPMKTGFY